MVLARLQMKNELQNIKTEQEQFHFQQSQLVIWRATHSVHEVFKSLLEKFGKNR